MYKHFAFIHSCGVYEYVQKVVKSKLAYQLSQFLCLHSVIHGGGSVQRHLELDLQRDAFKLKTSPRYHGRKEPYSTFFNVGFMRQRRLGVFSSYGRCDAP